MAESRKAALFEDLEFELGLTRKVLQRLPEAEVGPQRQQRDQFRQPDIPGPSSGRHPRSLRPTRPSVGYSVGYSVRSRPT
jgi:hypothetical protein